MASKLRDNSVVSSVEVPRPCSSVHVLSSKLDHCAFALQAMAWLAFLARKQGPAGQVSASEFRALSAALASASAAPIRHASLLQFGWAGAAAAQGAPAAAHWELMQREERQMALAASEGVHVTVCAPQVALFDRCQGHLTRCC